MQEFFEYYLELGGIHMKYSRSAPTVRGQEFHNFNEIIFFLGGKAKCISKSNQYDLKVGNIVFIPKNAYHQFIIEGNDYERCIVGFDTEEGLIPLLSSIGPEAVLIDKLNDATKPLLRGLLNVAKNDMPRVEKELYVQAAIVHLLFEIKTKTDAATPISFNLSKKVHDALILIDELYTEHLTIEKLSKRLRVSPSLLSHKFKEEMNISIYQYILKKRLEGARQMIQAGLPITVAAEQSGFGTYSCFLRSYKKRYGDLPSR